MHDARYVRDVEHETDDAAQLRPDRLAEGGKDPPHLPRDVVVVGDQRTQRADGEKADHEGAEEQHEGAKEPALAHDEAEAQEDDVAQDGAHAGDEDAEPHPQPRPP